MLDEVIERYIALRDRKAALKARYEEEAGKLDAAMTQCEAYIGKELERTGATSLKTKFGTAYFQNRSSATVADWDSLLTWILEKDMLNMLERRVSKAAVDEYIAAHSDLPPGVNYRQERVVNIRRT